MTGLEKPVVGATCSCGWACLRDLCTYICRKRRDALDLRVKFNDLKNEVNNLSAKWKQLDSDIGRLSITAERSFQYESAKESVSTIEERFKEIDIRYQQLCVNSRNQSPNIAVEKPRQKTAEMVRSCKLIAFARLYTKVETLQSDLSKVKKLKPEDLFRQVRPAVRTLPYVKEINIVGHPHKQYLDSVLQLIDKEDCKTICIHGIVPGVGVSNIMKNVNNYFLNPPTPTSICQSKFERVIWVAIQKQENIIESIQKEIISRLGAPTGVSMQETITSVLGDHEKKYLLLLEDFPSDIKLEDIGIPEGKVVMSTKDIINLRIMQDLDAEIEVKKLSHEESFYMFEQIFFKKWGQQISSDLEREEVDLILKHTDGILEVIQFVAVNLDKDREPNCLQNVGLILQSDVGPYYLKTAGLRNLYKEVNEKLDEDWKKCILFVALYPEGYVIPLNYLIECWNAQNFLDHYPRFKSVRLHGQLVLEKLEQRGLLDRDCEKHIKMSVYFRKFAKKDKAEASFVRLHPEDGLVRQPWSKDVKWICGAQTHLENLPPVSDTCDHLSVLLLQKNAQLVEIAFITSIPNILVLDMHGTGIKLLPTSISSLKKLRCLYLNGCRFLESLPNKMGDLTGLEVFDIRNTPIHCKSTDISGLHSLKCFRISFEKENAIWETPSRSWSCSLEELGIEFSKGVRQDVVDRVKQELRNGFGDSDHIKIYVPSGFGTHEELILEKILGQTTISPSTSGLKSDSNQGPDPTEHSTGLIELQEGVRSSGLTTESSAGSKQLSNKGKQIVEQGMTSGLIKEIEDNRTTSGIEIVEEESNGNPDKGVGSGSKKEHDQLTLKKRSIFRRLFGQCFRGFQKAPDPTKDNTISIELADKRVIQKGKEKVKELNEELQEGVPSGLTNEPSTSANQFSDTGVSLKRKKTLEQGMTSGLKKEHGDKETVEEQTNGNPDKGVGSGLKKEHDQPSI